MKMQLNQKEITQAIRQFVGTQGINMSGKDMRAEFTAGRKEGGLTVDLTIDDVTIPGFQVGQPYPTIGEPVSAAFDGKVATNDEAKNLGDNVAMNVPAGQAAPVGASATDVAPSGIVEVAEDIKEAVGEVPVANADVDTKVSNSTSLFGA